MKSITKRSLILFLTVCSIVLTAVLGGALSKSVRSELMPEHAVTTEIKTEMQAVSIKDVAGCKTINTFNIVKGEFLHNARPEGAVYTHDINDLGDRGTIQILIDNLDPMSQTFTEEAKALEYMRVESSYKFAIHIPAILSANVVYANAQFLSDAGEIEGYDFINFTNQEKVTENHTDKTEPITLNVSMTAERRFLSPDSPLRNGLLITIHYEAPEGKTAVLDGDVLIGEREAIDKVTSRESMALYLVQVLAIAALAMLIFVSILKKRIEFLPQILYVLGIAGAYTAAVIYDAPCEEPYTVLAIGSLSSALVALGIALSVKKKVWRIPIGMILSALAVLLCPLAFALPLLADGDSGSIALIIKISESVILISATILTAFETLTDDSLNFKFSGFAALVFVGISLFGSSKLDFLSPLYITSFLLLIITTVTSLREFVLLEKRNKYLTENLEAEVERQTESLKHIIGEREDLLRYISHDLRKPIIAIRKTLPIIIKSDKPTAEAAVALATAKLDTVDTALGEISKFSKTNYHAEQSVVLSLDETFYKVENELTSDCSANGVHLKIKSSGICVFAKSNALFSILSNLIFNALEHSGCDTIEISAESLGKKQCKITVSDNGHGAENAGVLFTPYNTAKDGYENSGLGLYISKQFAISMGGDIIYQRENNTTSFTVILPIV